MTATRPPFSVPPWGQTSGLSKPGQTRGLSPRGGAKRGRLAFSLRARQRLVRELLELRRHREIRRGHLGHEHADQLVLRVDPEEGAKGAAPPIRADPGR